MDLRAQLLELLAPWQVGDEPLPSVTLEDASTELGLRLRFRVDGERVWVDVTPIADARRFASRSSAFAFGYRTEGGRNPVDAALGLRLCKAIAERSAANEARVLAALRGPAELAAGEARIREVEVESLLELAGPASESFYTLSPYVGCLIGCKFCYAQSNVGALRRLLGLSEAPWGSYVDVRRNAPEVLARELADPARAIRPIKFCPVVSDPYQAIERKARITRGCLDAIAAADRPWPTLLLTRSPLILDDRERIAGLARAWVGVSLPTVDEEVRRHFEPRGATIVERLEVLRGFRALGVKTLAVVQPLLAGSLEAHADALAECVDSVSIDVLRGVEGAAEQFADPRHAETAREDWQLARAHALVEALNARGVPVWRGELPPELARDTPES
ncbi:radical SAM protein [Nannocystaceae bacterium ST9]